MTLHLRAIQPNAASINADARTVEAIVSTGAPVNRPGYSERLDLRGADLTRLNGAPVLDAHRTGSTRDQLGIVEAAELREEGLWVRIRFRSTDAARIVLDDIGTGTIRGLSIGYTVAEWKDGRDGDRRTRTAVKWTPHEVSIVPVPADPGAHFRGEQHVPEHLIEDPPQTATRAQMNVEIRTIATTAGLTRAWADEQIDAEATPDAARTAAFAEMQRRSAEGQPRTARASVGFDNNAPEVIAARAGEALFARSHPEHELSPEARAYAGLSMPELARESLRRAGVATTGFSADQVVTRALGLHSTSDFPETLGNAVHRELRRAYAAPTSGIRLLARQATARDFRPKTAIQFGGEPKLEKVNEAGEFRHGTFKESAERYSIATFGKIFGITRQSIINDDLGAFTTVPAKLGAAARSFEEEQLVAKLVANPNMADGYPVFDSVKHKNAPAAAAAPSLASLSSARLLMRRQTGLQGEAIAVTPRYVVAPPELETELEQLLSEIQATSTDEVNPFAKLTLVIEPRLADAATWYVAADPATIDGLEYSYLEGAPGPQIETRAGFEVDGVETKIRLDFGCGWLDYRGWYRSA